MNSDKIKPAAVAVDSLLSALDKLEESGQVLSWVRDWVLTDPQNAGTGAKYHGFNTLRCSLHNAIGGYAESLFITASGARSAGGSIKADEHNALAYIQGWKRRIKDEPAGAVVTSVSNSQKAVRLILGIK